MLWAMSSPVSCFHHLFHPVTLLTFVHIDLEINNSDCRQCLSRYLHVTYPPYYIIILHLWMLLRYQNLCCLDRLEQLSRNLTVKKGAMLKDNNLPLGHLGTLDRILFAWHGKSFYVISITMQYFFSFLILTPSVCTHLDDCNLFASAGLHLSCADCRISSEWSSRTAYRYKLCSFITSRSLMPFWSTELSYLVTWWFWGKDVAGPSQHLSGEIECSLHIELLGTPVWSKVTLYKIYH